MISEQDTPDLSTISGNKTTLRSLLAACAMHAELCSQGAGVDWSDRPDELATVAVSYADAMIDRLDDSKG